VTTRYISEHIKITCAAEQLAGYNDQEVQDTLVRNTSQMRETCIVVAVEAVIVAHVVHRWSCPDGVGVSLDGAALAFRSRWHWTLFLSRPAVVNFVFNTSIAFNRIWYDGGYREMTCGIVDMCASLFKGNQSLRDLVDLRAEVSGGVQIKLDCGSAAPCRRSGFAVSRYRSWK
jgi:hypothetical protein